MTNKKNKNLTEAATQSMGKTPISDNKPDYDASGRGSMVPEPIVAGNPVAMAVGAPIVPNSMVGAVMAKAPQTSSEEETEETTEEDENVEEVAEEARQQFRAALASLLGEENASDELIEQLEAIFEAAVTDRVEKTVATLAEGIDGNVKEYLDTVTESLVEKVDDYLDYVVEEWMQENAVAVEQGIKTQIAENFISGLKNLFENHYIDVPNEKYNVLDELYAQNRDLETKLNEAFNANINLRKQVELTECAGIFVAETKDLADTQISKLQSLMENVTFATPEEYRSKLVTVKENYLKPAKVSLPTRTIEPEQTFSKINNAPTTLVENYVGALGRLNKKV